MFSAKNDQGKQKEQKSDKGTVIDPQVPASCIDLVRCCFHGSHDGRTDKTDQHADLHQVSGFIAEHIFDKPKYHPHQDHHDNELNGRIYQIFKHDYPLSFIYT